MRAYKFLRAGAVGPFSLVAWPRPAQGRPGAWLHAAGPPRRCVEGVHACRPADLPHWLSDELWEVELRGPVAAEPIKLVAASGRLVARVECWGPEAAADYADACAARIDLPAYAQDAAADAAAARADASRAPVLAATTAFIAASAAGRAGGSAAAAAERAWQAQWLIGRLRLPTRAP